MVSQVERPELWKGSLMCCAADGADVRIALQVWQLSRCDAEGTVEGSRCFMGATEKVKLKEFVLLRWQLRGCVVVLQPVGLLGSGDSHEDGNTTETADRLRCSWVCWGVVLRL